MFDHFNRAPHNRLFRHKPGGRNHFGENGHQHKFAMGIILQNTFNAYNDIKKISLNTYNFRDYCVELTNDLFAYACTLNE